MTWSKAIRFGVAIPFIVIATAFAFIGYCAEHIGWRILFLSIAFTDWHLDNANHVYKQFRWDMKHE